MAPQRYFVMRRFASADWQVSEWLYGAGAQSIARHATEAEAMRDAERRNLAWVAEVEAMMELIEKVATGPCAHRHDNALTRIREHRATRTGKETT